MIINSKSSQGNHNCFPDHGKQFEKYSLKEIFFKDYRKFFEQNDKCYEMKTNLMELWKTRWSSGQKVEVDWQCANIPGYIDVFVDDGEDVVDHMKGKGDLNNVDQSDDDLEKVTCSLLWHCEQRNRQKHRGRAVALLWHSPKNNCTDHHDHNFDFLTKWCFLIINKCTFSSLTASPRVLFAWQK